MRPNIDLSPLHRKKIAFVCSGGVAKAGAWHLGVALALEELGFSFKVDQDAPLSVSTLVGSSAGSLICTYLAAGLTPQEIIESYLNYQKGMVRPISYGDILKLQVPKLNQLFKKKAYKPFEGLPTPIQVILKPVSQATGFFSTKGIRDYLKKEVLQSDRFEDYQNDLFIVGTQLDHSRKVIFSRYNFPPSPEDSLTQYYTGINISDAAAASMSVPPFFSPYPIKNPYTDNVDQYIDGEIRDTLSTHVAIDNRCKIIISSWTHTPYHFHREIGSLVQYGIPAIAIQSLLLIIQKKILSYRQRYLNVKDLYRTLATYLDEIQLDPKQKKTILTFIEKKLYFDPEIVFIDIFPEEMNHRMFFASAFSLSKEANKKLFQMGYLRAFSVFKKLYSV